MTGSEPSTIVKKRLTQHLKDRGFNPRQIARKLVELGLVNGRMEEQLSDLRIEESVR